MLLRPFLNDAGTAYLPLAAGVEFAHVSLDDGDRVSGDSLLIGDVGRPDLHVTGEAAGQARLLHGSLRRLLELPDHVVLYPSHYGGSVCGRGLSGNPFSSIGFERRHNPLLSLTDPGEFAQALLADLPPRPVEQQRIVAANRAGTLEVPA